jgi:L-iditol 2-dehydrogenase
MTISDTMAAMVFYGPGDLRMENVATPQIGESEVLIRVDVCGICGTDLSMFTGAFKVRRLPLIPGHEFAGEIVAIGDQVTEFSVGDRVTADINLTCGTCYWCRRSEDLLCPHLQQIGIDSSGGFAEYVKSPARQVHGLPDNISFELGASVEPLACAVHAQTRVDMPVGSSVAVIGGGPMGMMHAQLARLRGSYPVILIGRTTSKLNRAKQAGIDTLVNAREVDAVEAVRDLTGGRGADVVIESAGSLETYKQAFQMVRRGGTILAYGITPEDAVVDLHPFDLMKEEWKIVGSFVSHPSAWVKAITLLESGGVKPEVSFSMRVPLNGMLDAIAEAKRDRNVIKIFVAPHSTERETLEMAVG